MTAQGNTFLSPTTTHASTYPGTGGPTATLKTASGLSGGGGKGSMTQGSNFVTNNPLPNLGSKNPVYASYPPANRPPGGMVFVATPGSSKKERRAQRKAFDAAQKAISYGYATGQT
jgi:hypothetical protein